jgi:hypothetical protein
MWRPSLELPSSTAVPGKAIYSMADMSLTNPGIVSSKAKTNCPLIVCIQTEDVMRDVEVRVKQEGM